MKRIFIFLLLLVFAGCFASTTPTQHATDTINNDTQRLQWVGAFSFGVNKQLTLDIPNVQSAVEFNRQITMLADAPTNEQVAAVLNSLHDQAAREELGKQVDALIAEKRKIADDANALITSLTEQNAELKQQKEDTEAALQKFDGFWYTTGHAIKILLKYLMWIVGIFGVSAIAFLLLRAGAASNPILGSLFNMVSHCVAAVVIRIAKVFPALIEHIGAVKQDAYGLKASTLRVIVDTIDTLRDSDDVATLKTALSKAMDRNQKEAVKVIQCRE